MESRNDRIKHALRVAKVTQIELAEHLGSTRQNVVMHLSGKDCNSIELIQGVRMMTGARYEWLIDGKGPEFHPSESDVKKARIERDELQAAIDAALKRRGL